MITGLLDNMPCLTFDRDLRGLGLTVYPESRSERIPRSLLRG